MMELAIAATDLAEMLGSATALYLLFGLPIWAGVLITCADVLLLLACSAKRMRLLEAMIFGLIALIAACFAVQLSAVKPDWSQVMSGFIPRPIIVTDPGTLYIAISMLGKGLSAVTISQI